MYQNDSFELEEDEIVDLEIDFTRKMKKENSNSECQERNDKKTIQLDKQSTASSQLRNTTTIEIHRVLEENTSNVVESKMLSKNIN